MKKNYFVAFIAFAVFFLSSCGGAPTPPADTNSGPAASKPAVVTGEDLYKRNCVACHQANGEGLANSFPPLAKSDYLADKEKTIGQVIKGKTGEIQVNGKKYNNVMPAQQLSDEEIASVLTYVYTNLGNSGNAITVDEVKAVRAKL